MPAGIHMTMKKVTGRSSYHTMSHMSYHTLVCSNYEESVKHLVSSDKFSIHEPNTRYSNILEKV